MKMEFLNANYANTTTMFTVDSNTAGTAFIFDRRPNRQYTSLGYADDTTQTSIRIQFTNTVTVNRIVLQNTNAKNFVLYYGGVTANTLALTTSCGTAASSWTQNSATNLYMILASTTAMTSLSLDIRSTQTANEEKALGQLIVTSQLYTFTRNPDIGGYTPSVKAKEIKHEMSEGGTLTYRIRDKVKYDLRVRHNTDTANLRTVYDLNQEFYFAPFPTGTSWDGFINEVNWVGGFNVGRKPSQNYIQTGTDDSISLEETPS